MLAKYEILTISITVVRAIVYEEFAKGTLLKISVDFGSFFS